MRQTCGTVRRFPLEQHNEPVECLTTLYFVMTDTLTTYHTYLNEANDSKVEDLKSSTLSDHNWWETICLKTHPDTLGLTDPGTSMEIETGGWKVIPFLQQRGI